LEIGIERRNRSSIFSGVSDCMTFSFVTRAVTFRDSGPLQISQA
jgi:hypothetical protein